MVIDTTARSLAIVAYYVCLLDSQAMAFTSPCLPGAPFNPSPPLITDQQAGAMQMQAPTQEQVAAWHNYQAQLAQAYAMQAQAQAIGTAPLLAPPMMAAHMAPPFMPHLPMPMPVMPTMPTMAPMYVAPTQTGYTAPPTVAGAESTFPAEPLPQEGATEGSADDRVA